MTVNRFKLERDGEHELAREIRALTPAPEDVMQAVSEVLTAVREGGDAALLELRRKFETDAAPEQTVVSGERLRAALGSLDLEVRGALELAEGNIRKIALAELPKDNSTRLNEGQRISIKSLAVGSAGVYVPGGRAVYPSTVLMCCIPAKVAGVGRIVVTTPSGPEGEPHPVILAAALLAGADEVHAVGGAQAIAALAYGTDSIAPVDVIVGPGNAYVQEAKRQVFGTVGIDGIAGPSEVVMIADSSADPRLAALDLAAQAEHGSDSPAVAVADAPTLEAIAAEYEKLLPEAPALAEGQLSLVETDNLDHAVAFANAFAPEHLELQCHDAARVAERITTTGAIFYGPGGSAAFGDYVAGSNHVLPTGGAARFAGPLGSPTFRRRQALVSLTADAARALAPYASTLALAEGFPIHAKSAMARKEE